MIPRLTHLQFLVIGILLDEAATGKQLRAMLKTHGAKKSGPAFYQLMARMEEALREHDRFLVCNPVFLKKKCHPVLVRESCFNEILELDPEKPESRLDAYLHQWPKI